MSDFEYVDASSIVSVSRRSRPKYKHKPWEFVTDKEEARYLLLLSASWERRHKAKDTDAYAYLFTDRLSYEIGMETVFHLDQGGIDE